MPNISQYTFNNLFIIYLSHSSSTFIWTNYIRNQNIISVYQPKNCFKFEITLCHLVSSYTYKTTPNGAKVKMTFGIGCDVSKQTLTLTRIRCHLHVLLSCISYENLHYFPQNLFCRNEGLKVNHFLIIVYAIYTTKRTLMVSFYSFFNCCRRQDGCPIFSSQNKSSSSERDSLTPCNMHLTLCNMQKILHGYSSAK